MGPLQAFSDWLVRKAVREADTFEDLRAKQLWVPPATVGSALLLACLPPHLFVATIDDVAWLLAAFVLCTGTLILFLPRCTRQAVPATLAGLTLAVLLSDWGRAATLEFRPWPLLVTFAGVGAAAHDVRAYSAVLAAGVLWLAIDRAEAAARFGLYAGARFGSTDAVDACSCSSPPCTRTVYFACLDYIVAVLVLAVSLWFIRGYSDRLRAEQARAELVDNLCQCVAGHLSDNDLVAAEIVLQEQSDHLSEELAEDFARLLGNLREYQKYLPHSVLCPDSDSSEGSQERMNTWRPSATSSGGDVDPGGLQSTLTTTRPSLASTMGLPSRDPGESPWIPDLQEFSEDSGAPPPGPSGDDVTIVFTDVEGSTELWDRFPVGMQRALTVHNQVLRRSCADYSGYEVKVIGDSFMIAFGNPTEALGFCLQVQEQLVDASWPADILSLGRCAVHAGSGGRLWGGLRVRAGVHSGPARREANPVTGRADYFGGTVNTAARAESAAMVGGMVCITSPVWARVTETDPQYAATLSVANLGVAEMKGVADPPRLYAVFQRRLAERQAELVQARAERIKASSELRRISSARDWQKTRGKLQFGSATIAAVQGRFRDLPYVADCSAAISDFVGVVDGAVDRTGGSLVTVFDGSVLAAWGAAGRRCAQHAVQGLRAAGLLRRQMADGLYVGAASGPVVHGTVGTAKHLYVMVQGPSVDLAGRLGRAAVRFNSFALVAGCHLEPCGADDPSIRPLSRAVDVWPLASHIACSVRTITIWEVDVNTLGAEAGTWGAQLRAETTSEGAWGSDDWARWLSQGHGSPAGSAGREEAVNALRRIARIPLLPPSGHASPAGPGRSPGGGGPRERRATRSSPVCNTPPSPGAVRDEMSEFEGKRVCSPDHVLLYVIELVAAGKHIVHCPIAWNSPLPPQPTPQWLGQKAERRASRMIDADAWSEVSSRRPSVVGMARNPSTGRSVDRRRSNSLLRRPAPGQGYVNFPGMRATDSVLGEIPER
eukprot:TRINITY_DN3007_c0_g2_i1.p1 TRINITY_DN3007_c0_g2~~TRINITY_DN3007_c0_g2_i1.p1  ORF type:complete len:1001 (+),score=147.39 TRINITY_DN3007_c0_g2_i1:85-3087(+)